MTTALRVLVAGHDWGGLNILAPLLRAWAADPRIAPEFLSAPVARRDILHRVPGLRSAPGADALTEWTCSSAEDLDRFIGTLLDGGRYDAILCGTSAHALLERRLFVGAARAGIPSIAFCDMWFAYAERFRIGDDWTMPDQLWVIDEAMREATASVSWPRALPIAVIGSPLFGELALRRATRSAAGRAIRFISEPASIKFPEARIDEFALAEMLVGAAREAGLDLPVVIRPHPVDSMEAWRRWAFARRHDGVEIETMPVEEAITDTRLAVGISSILLGEMRMCGIPVASLQPDMADPSYYCLPFEELGIARVATAGGLAQWLGRPGAGAPPAAAEVHLRAIEAASDALLRLRPAFRERARAC